LGIVSAAPQAATPATTYASATTPKAFQGRGVALKAVTLARSLLA
jgi:hypothetical protein